MKQKLRLDRVQINNLFNRFNYDIDFRNGNDISILIAPNGCGKTTIFNLIEFIFNFSRIGYKKAMSTPFDSFICYLSNGNTVTLKKKKIKTHLDDRHDVQSRTLLSNYDLLLEISTPKNRSMIPPLNISNKIKRGYRRNYFLEDNENEDIDDIDGIDDIDDYIMYKKYNAHQERRLFHQEQDSVVAHYLEENDCKLEVNFIRSNRVYRAIPLMTRSRWFGSGEDEQNPLAKIQKKIQLLIKKIADDYSNKQNEAKDVLPNLYLNKNYINMDFSDFKDRWSKYIGRIEKYHEIGLIEQPKQIIKNNRLKKAYDKKGAFLEVYLETYEKALDPLEHEYTKLKLFKDILDKRNQITKKTFLYSNEGIVVYVDGETLPLEALSSGEKNDFVMFYNLIFASEDNSLVLIDEPEISLHIAWQEDYLELLMKICEMNHLQAVVATHSPNIINGHFEFFPKKGFSDESK